jgi:hypothetical protein
MFLNEKETEQDKMSTIQNGPVNFFLMAFEEDRAAHVSKI